MDIGNLWPLLVYAIVVFILVIFILLVSYVLGEKTHGRATNDIFESGIVTVGYARLRFPPKFYLIAMFFVIFDLETVFLFAWAIAFRETGWPGYIEASIFIGVLLASLAYLWRLGGLDWGPKGHRTKTENSTR